MHTLENVFIHGTFYVINVVFFNFYNVFALKNVGKNSITHIFKQQIKNDFFFRYSFFLARCTMHILCTSMQELTYFSRLPY